MKHLRVPLPPAFPGSFISRNDPAVNENAHAQRPEHFQPLAGWNTTWPALLASRCVCVGVCSNTPWTWKDVCLSCVSVMSWELAQGASCLTPEGSWDQLDPLGTLQGRSSRKQIEWIKNMLPFFSFYHRVRCSLLHFCLVCGKSDTIMFIIVR